MKVDVEAAVNAPAEAPGLAKKAEDVGFDCFWVNETRHDPFVQLSLSAASTKKIELGTSIALAFTRSPTTMAYIGWDVQSLSRGRLNLGLGSQVKGHVERRFGMKWEAPAPKMKEYVLALRAVWQCWQTGGSLDFDGRYYRINLMTPFFNPGPIERSRIPVYVAGMNVTMCGVAGRVGDGLHVHPLHTARYLREVVMAGLEAGLKQAGRKRTEVQVAASVFAAVGETEAEIKNLRESYRQQIAFYASTKTYRRLLELHGWGDIGDALRRLSFKGEWDEMATHVPDDMLGEFVVEGSWRGIGEILTARYQGAVDRIRLYLPFDGRREWKTFLAGFRA